MNAAHSGARHPLFTDPVMRAFPPGPEANFTITNTNLVAHATGRLEADPKV